MAVTKRQRLNDMFQYFIQALHSSLTLHCIYCTSTCNRWWDLHDIVFNENADKSLLHSILLQDLQVWLASKNNEAIWKAYTKLNNKLCDDHVTCDTCATVG